MVRVQEGRKKKKKTKRDENMKGELGWNQKNSEVPIKRVYVRAERGN